MALESNVAINLAFKNEKKTRIYNAEFVTRCIRSHLHYLINSLLGENMNIMYINNST